MARTIPILMVLSVMMSASQVNAQISSLGEKARRQRAKSVQKALPREAPKETRNLIYDQYSWITADHVPPKQFKVGDLITIIVRESRQYNAKSDLKIQKDFDLRSDIKAFLKLTRGGVGNTEFQRGVPNIDYTMESELQGKGDAKRNDRMTMRLSGRIIDVKPNGLLVLEAKARVQHDDEISTMTLTGMCRKEDVTADNTILSTQVADKVVSVLNEGALRNVSTRGWLIKFIEFVSPF